MADLQKAIETVQDMLDVVASHGSCYVYKHNGGDDRLRNVLDCLKAQQEREKNEPLTETQIRELPLKEWLYVEVIGDCGRSKSAYYRVQYDYSKGEALCCGYPGLGFEFDYCDYGKTWLAYRNKPKKGA